MGCCQQHAPYLHLHFAPHVGCGGGIVKDHRGSATPPWRDSALRSAAWCGDSRHSGRASLPIAQRPASPQWRFSRPSRTLWERGHQRGVREASTRVHRSRPLRNTPRHSDDERPTLPQTRPTPRRLSATAWAGCASQHGTHACPAVMPFQGGRCKGISVKDSFVTWYSLPLSPWAVLSDSADSTAALTAAAPPTTWCAATNIHHALSRSYSGRKSPTRSTHGTQVLTSAHPHSQTSKQPNCCEQHTLSNSHICLSPGQLHQTYVNSLEHLSLIHI